MKINLYGKNFDVDDNQKELIESIVDHVRVSVENGTKSFYADFNRDKLAKMFDVEDYEKKSIKQVQEEIKERLLALEKAAKEKTENIQQAGQIDNEKLLELKQSIANIQSENERMVNDLKTKHLQDMAYNSILPHAVKLGLHESEQKHFLDTIKKDFAVESKNGGFVFMRDDMPIMSDNKPAAPEYIAKQFKELYPSRFIKPVSGTGTQGNFNVDKIDPGKTVKQSPVEMLSSSFD